MYFALIFRKFVTFWTIFNQIKKSYCPLNCFFRAFVFGQDFESAKAWESIRKKINAKDIVVVHIGFFNIFPPIFLLRVGSTIDIRKVLILRTFFRNNTSLLNLLLSSIELKLFKFNRSFIWYQAKVSRPLKKRPRRAQCIGWISLELFCFRVQIGIVYLYNSDLVIP